jgi:nucleotide-binding universal stress UspA family protein
LLLVAGTGHGNERDELPPGSIIRSLLRGSACPVLLVPAALSSDKHDTY